MSCVEVPPDQSGAECRGPVRRRSSELHDAALPAASGPRPGRRELPEATSAALRDLCRAVSDAEGALARRLDLRAGEYRAVKIVLYSHAPLGISELAHRLGLSKGTTSELVDRLQERGLLERERHAGDGRRVVLRATQRALGQVHGDLGALFGALADVARERDAATLHGISDFLRDAARALTTRTPPRREVTRDAAALV